MKYYIVTGASKGLGKALLTQLAAEDVHIFAISRSGVDESTGRAVVASGASLSVLPFDLTEVEKIEGLMTEIIKEIDAEKAEQIVLINNAGGVEPIGPFYKAQDAAVLQNIHLNLTSPLLLANHFGRAVKNLSCDRRIITVSSGAGKNPIYGWTTYCATKAAVDMMTRVIGLEEGAEGIQAASFGPGIMDTDMQVTIRSSSAEDFKDIERFKGFKENGNLLTPQYVADVLKRFLIDTPFEQGAVVSVKDYEGK